MLAKNEIPYRISLIGLESSGKTTLFSKLTNQALGEQTNIKGSTYSVRAHRNGKFEYVDTPGVHGNETFSNEMVRNEMDKADRVVFVVRGTHLQEELSFLTQYISRFSKPVLVVATYADKMTATSKGKLMKEIVAHRLPLLLFDSRHISKEQLENFHACIEEGFRFTEEKMNHLLGLELDKVEPRSLWLDHPVYGKWLSVFLLIGMFLFPVMVAYFFSDAISPLAERFMIQPIREVVQTYPTFVVNLLVGQYGILSLGIYSFIWAFPVVVLVGCATAIADETGLKDRIVDVLDPSMRKIGLNGKDLIPVLSGFGCNVVAVYQTRGCSLCTRKSCISLISFGSACSYQIGATLSVFNSAQKPWLFLPYLLLLLAGGILHTRLWNRGQLSEGSSGLRKTFLQKPTRNGFIFRLNSDLKQFCTQALPIFFIICIVSTLLYEAKLLQAASMIFRPLLKLLELPADAATGLVFSIIRKDGILLFNEGNGELLKHLDHLQLLLLVFLASTLTSCVVTMMAIWKEIGPSDAIKLIFKQLATCFLCTGLIYGLSSLFV